MKRYPAYDPVEYQQWQPDSAVMQQYQSKIEEPRVEASVESLGATGLIDLYKGLLRARLHDIALKRGFALESSPRPGSVAVRKQ